MIGEGATNPGGGPAGSSSHGGDRSPSGRGPGSGGGPGSDRSRSSGRNESGQHLEVLRLAIPAFLALVAEPLFLLTDAAIVGRLGVEPLAGLGVASAILLTAANVFVFLAYGTTAVVARQLGAGDRPGAIAGGIDGTCSPSPWERSPPQPLQQPPSRCAGSSVPPRAPSSRR